MNSIRIMEEAFNEVMQDLNMGEPPETLSQNDLSLGDTAAQLAQVKGELSAILDRAYREGIIKKKDGRISILNRDAYTRAVGDLPKKIKQLQQTIS